MKRTLWVLGNGIFKSNERLLTTNEVEKLAGRSGVCYFCRGPASLRIGWEHRFENRNEIHLQYSCDKCWNISRPGASELRSIDRSVSEMQEPRRTRHVNAPLETAIAKVRAQEKKRGKK